MNLTINDLITHRFRGFASQENTLEGLKAALEHGVRLLEFDIRVARCGTPMIYHDAEAKDGRDTKRFLCDHMACEFKALGGVFDYIPSAEALLEIASQHADDQTILMIDIKDAGFEDEILALVHLFKLQDQVIYVSWVPEVLYALHARNPDARLCLSHWCQAPPASERLGHDVFEAVGNNIPFSGRTHIHGESSGWFTRGPLRGPMREMVSFVCVPQEMISPGLVADYHQDDIQVCTYSYLDWDHIKTHKSKMNIDLYFIDNKAVFDAL